MAAKMNNQIQKNEEEQAEEDMNALRALLENLLHFSFEQEGLMEDLKTIDMPDDLPLHHSFRLTMACKCQRLLSKKIYLSYGFLQQD